MAAVIAPPAAAGAPTVVTTSGTVPADNLANSTLLANDPFVISHPPLPFIFSVVIPGGGHQTASLAMGRASRTWTGRLTLNNPGYNQPRFNLQRLTVAFTGAAFLRLPPPFRIGHGRLSRCWPIRKSARL